MAAIELGFQRSGFIGSANLGRCPKLELNSAAFGAPNTFVARSTLVIPASRWPLI